MAMKTCCTGTKRVAWLVLVFKLIIFNMHGKSTSMLEGSSKQTGVLLGNWEWHDEKKKKEKFLHKLPAMNLSKAMAVCVRYLNTKIRT